MNSTFAPNVTLTAPNCDVFIDFTSFNYSQHNFPRPEIFAKVLSWNDCFKIVICVVTVIAILIGNASVILAVALNPSLRNTINYYLTNLAVADILICVICLTVHLINNLTDPLYVLGHFMCKFNGFAQSKSLFIYIRFLKQNKFIVNEVSYISYNTSQILLRCS